MVFPLGLHFRVPFPLAKLLVGAVALLYFALIGVQLETVIVVVTVPVSFPQLGAVAAPADVARPTTDAGIPSDATAAAAKTNLRMDTSPFAHPTGTFPADLPLYPTSVRLIVVWGHRCAFHRIAGAAAIMESVRREIGRRLARPRSRLHEPVVGMRELLARSPESPAEGSKMSDSLPSGARGAPFRVARGATSVAQARGLVRRAMALLPPSVGEAAELLTSEVVTNAMLHGGGPFSLELEVLNDHLRVSVMDGTSERPAVLEAPVDAEHGRGMAIVAAMASAWGTKCSTPASAFGSS